MGKAQCEQRAKEMAERLLRASADPLEVQYAIGQLMPLYEMIEEGGDESAEVKRLRSALDDIASGCACLPGYSAADAAAAARQALAPRVEP